jgi:hypothetical protein
MTYADRPSSRPGTAPPAADRYHIELLADNAPASAVYCSFSVAVSRTRS